MTRPYPAVTILGTHMRKLKSAINGQDYELSVWLPPSYRDSQCRYPVLYMLDGPVWFGVKCMTAFAMTWWGPELPDMIVVGIGNPICSYDDWGPERNRDYTPGVVAGSPAVDYDRRVMFNCESEYARAHTALPARLFINAGALEDGEYRAANDDFARRWLAGTTKACN
jgi:hypothetical protein